MTVHTPVEQPTRKQAHLAVHLPGAACTGGSFEQLARTAERGLFDFLFLSGHKGRIHELDVAGGPEPITVLNALAAVTERLGLAASADTTFNEPYELARRFATLDHLSGGRAAWDVVTSSDASSSFGESGSFGSSDAYMGENFRRGGFPDRSDPLTRAAEFVATAREVWDSWTPDGVSRPFAHRGRYFDIAGEFTVPRSPQGHPVAIVVIRAGDSSEGREFAASAADVVLTRHGALESAREFYADVKGRLAGYGRAYEDLKIMPVAAFVLGDTAVEAAGLQSFIGTPESVAAEIDEFVTTDAADGFVLVPRPAPGGLDAFVDRVVPLLQERGVFRTEYTGATLRSHLGLRDPVWKG